MENDYKVKVENVTKEYELFKTQSEKLRSFFSITKTCAAFLVIDGGFTYNQAW